MNDASGLPSFGEVPPGFTPILTLEVSRSPSGGFYVLAKEYRGFHGFGRTLADALAQVPVGFRELLAAGAVVPSLDGVELSEEKTECRST